MEFISTEIAGPLIIRPRVLSDRRGFFMECFRENAFRDHGIIDRFVQDNCSFSVGGAGGKGAVVDKKEGTPWIPSQKQSFLIFFL